MWPQQQKAWVDLLNAALDWDTDASMLQVIPEEAREFESTPEWPRLKALAYLNNNVTNLRYLYERLEAGVPMDFDFVNNVLAGIRLRLVNWPGHPEFDARRREKWAKGERLAYLLPRLRPDGVNRGSAHIRLTVECAFYAFAQYSELRLSDPAYPGSSPGSLRVVPCARGACGRLTVGTADGGVFCSAACSEDTGRMSGVS